MSLPTIRCLWKCVCTQDDMPVEVPSRAPTEDLMLWMNKLQHAVTEDHIRRSPLCQATKMTHVKIPVDEHNKHVGEFTRKH